MPHSISRRRFIGVSTAAIGAVALDGPSALGEQALFSAKGGKRDRGKGGHKDSPLPDPRGVERLGLSLADLGVLQAASLLQARRASPLELLRACQTRISARNGPMTFGGSPDAINALIRRYDDVAIGQAEAAMRRLGRAHVRREGRAPYLTGIPLVLKDLYAVAGLPLTASSRVLAGNVAPGDSEVWRRL